MDYTTKNKNSQQTFLTLQFTLIIAAASTAIIYIIDRFALNHSDFRPLTEFQFYGILFIVIFGLVAGLLFYREEKDVVSKDVGELRMKMSKKKLKKDKKARLKDQ
jgi:hypothetical protein